MDLGLLNVVADIKKQIPRCTTLSVSCLPSNGISIFMHRGDECRMFASIQQLKNFVDLEYYARRGKEILFRKFE